MRKWWDRMLGCRFQLSPPGMQAQLIGGTGAASVIGLRQAKVSTHPVIVATLNMLAYSSFESANYTTDWTLLNGAASGDELADSGRFSLSLPSRSGTNVRAIAVVGCKLGQMSSGELWYLAHNVGAVGGRSPGSSISEVGTVPLYRAPDRPGCNECERLDARQFLQLYASTARDGGRAATVRMLWCVEGGAQVYIDGIVINVV